MAKGTYEQHIPSVWVERRHMPGDSLHSSSVIPSTQLWTLKNPVSCHIEARFFKQAKQRDLIHVKDNEILSGSK